MQWLDVLGMHPAQKAGFIVLVVFTIPFAIVAPYWILQGHVSHSIVSVFLAGLFGVLAYGFKNADARLFSPTE